MARSRRPDSSHEHAENWLTKTENRLTKTGRNRSKGLKTPQHWTVHAIPLLTRFPLSQLFVAPAKFVALRKGSNYIPQVHIHDMSTGVQIPTLAMTTKSASTLPCFPQSKMPGWRPSLLGFFFLYPFFTLFLFSFCFWMPLRFRRHPAGCNSKGGAAPQGGLCRPQQDGRRFWMRTSHHAAWKRLSQSTRWKTTMCIFYAYCISHVFVLLHDCMAF